MNLITRLFGIVLISICFVGCSQTKGEPTIDASTNDGLQSSLSEIRSTLEGEEKEAFEESMAILMYSQLVWSGETLDIVKTGQGMEKRIHGKTAKEIIADAANEKKLMTEAQIKDAQFYRF